MRPGRPGRPGRKPPGRHGAKAPSKPTTSFAQSTPAIGLLRNRSSAIVPFGSARARSAPGARGQPPTVQARTPPRRKALSKAARCGGRQRGLPSAARAAVAPCRASTVHVSSVSQFGRSHIRSATNASVIEYLAIRQVSATRCHTLRSSNANLLDDSQHDHKHKYWHLYPYPPQLQIGVRGFLTAIRLLFL